MCNAESEILRQADKSISGRYAHHGESIHLEGLDFIVEHFEEPMFPRTISTYATQGGQFEVFSKEEVVKGYEQSDFPD